MDCRYWCILMRNLTSRLHKISPVLISSHFIGIWALSSRLLLILPKLKNYDTMPWLWLSECPTQGTPGTLRAALKYWNSVGICHTIALRVTLLTSIEGRVVHTKAFVDKLKLLFVLAKAIHGKYILLFIFVVKTRTTHQYFKFFSPIIGCLLCRETGFSYVLIEVLLRKKSNHLLKCFRVATHALFFPQQELLSSTAVSFGCGAWEQNASARFRALTSTKNIFVLCCAMANTVHSASSTRDMWALLSMM